MKKFFKPLPDLDERLDRVDDRMRQVRRSLDRQVDEALIPLDIQEDFTISELEGDVMLVSRNDDLHDKVRNLLRSEGYGCDIPERTSEAIGLLKLRKYRMVIADYTRRRRGRLFEYIKRYQPHVKIVSIVRNNDEGQRVMRAGSYSYLLGRDFDAEQLRTCLISSLKLRHRVCWLLAHGERCNRSCVDSFQSDEDFGEIE
ncbi:MAG: hypothetical protein OXD49_15995 [Candidatus Poribacteria bacterium]|nr:hypothetical protein [Candidatus Poribacteria bacterium]